MAFIFFSTNYNFFHISSLFFARKFKKKHFTNNISVITFKCKLLPRQEEIWKSKI